MTAAYCTASLSFVLIPVTRKLQPAERKIVNGTGMIQDLKMTDRTFVLPVEILERIFCHMSLKELSVVLFICVGGGDRWGALTSRKILS